MSLRFVVDPARPHGAAPAVDAAVAALASGEPVVFPTETVYGIACRPDRAAATARLFKAKRRPEGLALPVLAATAEEALALAGRPPAAPWFRGVPFWPGPVTFVLPRGERSKAWPLGAREETIALRVPDHPIARAVLERSGPLAVSSANVSREAPASTERELVEAFGDLVAVYLVVPEALRPDEHPPSSIIDLSGERPRLLRRGAVVPVIPGTGPEIDSVD